jgi:hypothetical protein
MIFHETHKRQIDETMGPEGGPGPARAEWVLGTVSDLPPFEGP